MSRTEYFHVFEAIIYGLALTEILIGFNKMIEARRTIKLYWAHLLFIFIYIDILIANYTWQFYRNPYDLVDSVFTFIIFVAIYPISFFFGAYQGFPKNFENTDFKVFFHSRRKEILMPVLIMQIAAVIKTSADVISLKGSDHFFYEHITTQASISDFWLQVSFVPIIAFATFNKKVWPSEVMAVLGLAAQTYMSFVKFRPID